MFHRFHQSGTPSQGQGSLTDRELERLLTYVGLERILSPEQWMAAVKTNTLKDSDICITLDDGLRSQADVALPVLERYGLSAFWFVFSSVFKGEIDRNEVYNLFASTTFASFDEFVRELFEFFPVPESRFEENGYSIFATRYRDLFAFYSEEDLRYRFFRNRLVTRDRFEEIMDAMIESKGLSVAGLADKLWLTDEDLISLTAAGHTVGMHSYSHPFNLSELSSTNQRDQYLLNLQHITEMTGKKVDSMSHPLNSYSSETLDLLTEMKITCGFRSNMAPPSHGRINGHPLELAREDSVNVLRALNAIH